MQNLQNIKIILCETTHSGNIGSAARAMKTMGLTNLVLVAPKAIIDDYALALASNARDIIEKAIILDSLKEALNNVSIAIALSARKREFNYNLQTPKEIVPEILSTINNNSVAIVFGTEKNGLNIEQLELCNRLVTIPGNPEYSSLNLAQAVQIMCYEIYSQYNPDLTHLKSTINQANINDTQRILTHIDSILDKINFYKNKNITKRRLQKILNKASLEKEEVDLIHGILNKIEQKLYF